MLRADIFDGPQLRDKKYETSIYEVEVETWKAFVLVKNFTGNKEATNHSELVTNMLTALEEYRMQ